jgi:hypothetical protein
LTNTMGIVREVPPGRHHSFTPGAQRKANVHRGT